MIDLFSIVMLIHTCHWKVRANPNGVVRPFVKLMPKETHIYRNKHTHPFPLMMWFVCCSFVQFFFQIHTISPWQLLDCGIPTHSNDGGIYYIEAAMDRPAATCDNLTDWIAFNDDKLIDFNRHQDVSWLTSCLCLWLILLYLIINAMTILQPNRKQYSFSFSVFIQIFIKLWSNHLASVVAFMEKSLSVRCCH